MNIPTDTVIEQIIADATYIAKRSNHALAWHAVQCLQQLRAPLHTQAERNAALDAVSRLYATPGFTSPIYHADGRVEDAYDCSQDDLDDLLTKFERYMDNDTIAAEAAAFGAGAVETAIDQQDEGNYTSLDDALCSGYENACDTLSEVFHALRDDGRYVAAYRAMERAFRDRLAKHGLTCSLFI
jgi:hypothetical protein